MGGIFQTSCFEIQLTKVCSFFESWGIEFAGIPISKDPLFCKLTMHTLKLSAMPDRFDSNFFVCWMCATTIATTQV